MKKKITAIILMAALVLALAIPMAAPAAAHLEGAPFVTVLVADGGSEATHVDVGTVSVWNDSENLYVKYETTDGWVMTGTHLEVATGEPLIPQNKKGNPKVGHFSRNEPHDPPVTVWEEVFNLAAKAWDPGIPLFIAAHADVVQPTDEWEPVWQIGDVEVVNGGTGWLENYADEFNWGDPAGPITMGPGLNASQPAFADPFIVGTTDTNEFPYNSNTRFPYATDFDVQWDGSLTFGGQLTISWSPGRSANETKIVVGDGISSTSFSAIGTTRTGEGWFLDTYPLVENVVPINPLSDGVHTINFQHTEGDGTFWDWVRLEKPIEQEETAWGGWHDGTRFTSKGNWATWFTYEMQPLLDSTGGADAVWDSFDSGDGGGSYYLTSGNVTAGDEARIVITLPSGTTLGDIDSISWWTYLVSGYVPHVDIVLDKDDNGFRDDVLVAEGAYQNGDSTTGWSTGSWFQTFDGVTAAYPSWAGLIGAPSVTEVDDTTAVWLNSSGQASIDKLSAYKAGTAVGTVDSSTVVLALEIEVDNWVAQSEAYVDDIAITLS